MPGALFSAAFSQAPKPLAQAKISLARLLPKAPQAREPKPLEPLEGSSDPSHSIKLVHMPRSGCLNIIGMIL